MTPIRRIVPLLLGLLALCLILPAEARRRRKRARILPLCVIVHEKANLWAKPGRKGGFVGSVARRTRLPILRTARAGRCKGGLWYEVAFGAWMCAARGRPTWRFPLRVQVEPGSSGARRKERGEAYMSRAAEAFHAAGVGIETQALVTPLPPEQAIVEFAVDNDMDLIIMATLTESAVGRFLFGSVAEKVRRRSPIPVLFVAPVQAEERGE